MPDGLLHLRSLLLTQWTSPTPWTQPQTPHSANWMSRSHYLIMMLMMMRVAKTIIKKVRLHLTKTCRVKNELGKNWFLETGFWNRKYIEIRTLSMCHTKHETMSRITDTTLIVCLWTTLVCSLISKLKRGLSPLCPPVYPHDFAPFHCKPFPVCLCSCQHRPKYQNILSAAARIDFLRHT